MKKELTFEEIDAQVQRINLTDFESGGKYYFQPSDTTTQPSEVLQKICPIYKVIRPILVLISGALKPSWKEAIKTFMNLMDAICP